MKSMFHFATNSGAALHFPSRWHMIWTHLFLQCDEDLFHMYVGFKLERLSKKIYPYLSSTENVASHCRKSLLIPVIYCGVYHSFVFWNMDFHDDWMLPLARLICYLFYCVQGKCHIIIQCSCNLININTLLRFN